MHGGDGKIAKVRFLLANLGVRHGLSSASAPGMNSAAAGAAASVLGAKGDGFTVIIMGWLR